MLCPLPPLCHNSSMRFEFLVALRYMKAKRKQAVVSVITVISVIGVASGVAALVIALAINTGFREDLQEKLLGAQAHVMLMNPNLEGISDYMEIVRVAKETEGVRAAAPALYQGVLLSNSFQNRGVWLKGIVVELESARSDIVDNLAEGRIEDFDDDGIILGVELARAIGSFVGDRVRVLSAETYMTPMGFSPRTRTLDVVGLFESGLYELDAGYAYVTMARVQQLLGLEDVASRIEIQIEDIDRSEAVAEAVLARLGGELEYTDWKEQNTVIFQALRLERLVMFITIGLIVLVASLNIVVTLVMMVLEKTRDIAVLMSMGATRENIRRVFVAQGVIIGVIGTALGLIVGNLASYLADTYRWVSLPPDVYSIAYVPFRPDAWDSAVVGVAAILISYLATLYPSRAASSLEPVEALRYE